MTTEANQPHALYRFYDAGGLLLYIGVTLDPGARWKSHRKDRPWWHHVAQVTLEVHSSRLAVLEAERAAILAEKPLHNVVHNRGTRHDVEHRALVRAEDMPDDCHDHCVKAGIDAIYLPFKWRNGIAHYLCQHGHRWTCSWGHDQSGDARRNAGHPRVGAMT